MEKSKCVYTFGVSQKIFKICKIYIKVSFMIHNMIFLFFIQKLFFFWMNYFRLFKWHIKIIFALVINNNNNNNIFYYYCK